MRNKQEKSTKQQEILPQLPDSIQLENHYNDLLALIESMDMYIYMITTGDAVPSRDSVYTNIPRMAKEKTQRLYQITEQLMRNRGRIDLPAENPQRTDMNFLH